MIICPECKTENPSKALHCMKCGALLVGVEELPEEIRLKRELNAAKEAIAKLNKELDEAKQTNREREKSLEESMQDVEILKTELEKVRQENDGLREESYSDDADNESESLNVPAVDSDYDDIDDYELESNDDAQEVTSTSRVLKENAPCTVSTMVLGVLSIICSVIALIFLYINVFNFLAYCAPALILGIAGLRQSKKGRRICSEFPEMYNSEKLRIGRVLCIIGIVLIVFSFLLLIIKIK